MRKKRVVKRYVHLQVLYVLIICRCEEENETVTVTKSLRDGVVRTRLVQEGQCTEIERGLEKARQDGIQGSVGGGPCRVLTTLSESRGRAGERQRQGREFQRPALKKLSPFKGVS
jgi:hypothetical protein